MNDEYPPNYIAENYKVFDRFTFDYLFKKLLADGYDNEEAKNIILFNCALSLLVMQERLDNDYYWKITPDDGVAPDLLEIYSEELHKAVCNKN